MVNSNEKAPCSVGRDTVLAEGRRDLQWARPAHANPVSRRQQSGYHAQQLPMHATRVPPMPFAPHNGGLVAMCARLSDPTHKMAARVRR